MRCKSSPTLQNSPVRGIQYEGRAKWAKIAKEGDVVALIPEPDNSYDAFAVKVVTRSGNLQLGYVPREISREVSTLLKRSGTAFSAFISEKTKDSTLPFLMIQASYDCPEPSTTRRGPDISPGSETNSTGSCLFGSLLWVGIIYALWGAGPVIFLSVIALSWYWGWKKGNHLNE